MKFLAALALIAVPLAFRRRSSLSDLGFDSSRHVEEAEFHINTIAKHLENFPSEASCKSKYREIKSINARANRARAHLQSGDPSYDDHIRQESRLSTIQDEIDVIDHQFYNKCIVASKHKEGPSTEETEKERLIRFFKPKLPTWKPGDPL